MLYNRCLKPCLFKASIEMLISNAIPMPNTLQQCSAVKALFIQGFYIGLCYTGLMQAI